MSSSEVHGDNLFSSPDLMYTNIFLFVPKDTDTDDLNDAASFIHKIIIERVLSGNEEKGRQGKGTKCRGWEAGTCVRCAQETLDLAGKIPSSLAWVGGEQFWGVRGL